MNKLTEYHEKILNSKSFEFFKDSYFNNLAAYKMAVEFFTQKHEPVKNSILLGVVNNILVPFIGSPISILDLVALIDTDSEDYLYSRALNNGIIAGYTSKWFKLSDKERDILILSALYSNLGKFKISKELLDKPYETCTEDEIEELNSHPILSYNLIQNFPVDINVKLAALMHHERFDGRGYPQQLIANRINKYAKLLAIISFYSKRYSVMSNCSLESPFDIIASLEADNDGAFDSSLSLIFAEMLAKETIGREFLLSDGRICSVVMINRANVSKPMLLYDNQYIDLSKESNLTIIDYK